MKVLFCSSEVVPFAKTGGLADVAGALPLALENKGVEVAIAMPKYKTISDDKFNIKKTDIDSVYQAKIGKNIAVYFIDNKKYFDRRGLYGDENGDFPDNLERFSFYCKTSLDLLKKINFKADIIHCNDWHAALIPVFLKILYKKEQFYKKIKTILTIHNIGYQGLFLKEEFGKLGISREFFSIDGLEFFGKINCLKGGMIFSDFITTVSPTYSKEIQTEEFGCGLEGVLSKRRGSVFGIINGLDYSLWDPSRDNLIFKKYSLKSLKDKYINKTQLQKKCKLPQDESIPLFGFVGRLAEQKGIDILSEVIEKIARLDMQTVILGTGDIRYHKILTDLTIKFPKIISVVLEFDNALAHQIYAGSDFFLLPSRYEPCGLGQMISMKYASIPVARRTGGLVDTIVDFDPLDNSGSGFIFDSYSAESLLKAIKTATYFYRDKKIWKGLLNRALKSDFPWDESAKQYTELYNRCLSLA